jgi:hypothetical protein
MEPSAVAHRMGWGTFPGLLMDAADSSLLGKIFPLLAFNLMINDYLSTIFNHNVNE